MEGSWSADDESESARSGAEYKTEVQQEEELVPEVLERRQGRRCDTIALQTLRSVQNKLMPDRRYMPIMGAIKFY